MEHHDKDLILRQALAPTEPRRLPSNFAFTTMRRIRQEQRRAERRRRIGAIACVVAVTLLGIGSLVVLFGNILWQAFLNSVRQPGASSLILPTLFCLAFFAVLNRWLSRRFGFDAKNRLEKPLKCG